MSADVSPQAAEQAVHWWLQLRSSQPDRQAWQRWCAADPEHARAWQQIEAQSARMAGLSAPLAQAALDSAARARKRRALRLLGVAALAGGSGLVLHAQLPWRAWSADQRAAIGEQRRLALPDGGWLLLNTGSAVNLRFDAGQREVALVAGEILVQTAPDAAGRPFRVQTPAGTVRPLGTRFTVRHDGAATTVGVLQGAVELQPADAPAALRRLDAGQSGGFDRHGTAAPDALDEAATAWTEGLLVASGMPLARFLAELARYRRGHLGCDPAVAALRVSGVYPLHDTDQVLAALTTALPLRLEQTTRWWVTVRPAHAQKT
ncbi:MAG: FecR domain-containing protein [Pseudorhodoferax sp.]